MPVRIGLIGIGFMGMTHFEGARKLQGGRIAAIATRSENKLRGDWSDIQGNFGPRGTHMDLSGHALHADYADLLRNATVDLVDLCVPNDAHARMAIQALEAGKHVLVEKPIAMTTADADAMTAAARSNGAAGRARRGRGRRGPRSSPRCTTPCRGAFARRARRGPGASRKQASQIVELA